jgi:hypothetical protein
MTMDDELTYRHGLAAALAARRAAGLTREQLGEEVRQVWVAWAANQPDPEPSWLVSFAELSPAGQEADMLIGEALFGLGWLAARRQQP